MGYIKILLVGVCWLICMLLPVRQWVRLALIPFAWVIPKLRPYTLRNWIADDQDMFTFIGGANPDHTISGHVGITCYKHPYPEKPEYHQAKKIINGVFFWQDDHCFEAIEWDEITKN
jgi:hypothetical protein